MEMRYCVSFIKHAFLHGIEWVKMKLQLPVIPLPRSELKLIKSEEMSCQKQRTPYFEVYYFKNKKIKKPPHHRACGLVAASLFLFPKCTKATVHLERIFCTVDVHDIVVTTNVVQENKTLHFYKWAKCLLVSFFISVREYRPHSLLLLQFF